MDWRIAGPLSRLLPRRFHVPEVGQSPHDVALAFGRSRLLAYRPTRPADGRGPVLLVPSLVNRHYILDLVPGRSVVERFLARGYPTYMIDWGHPGPEDATLSMDALLFDRLATAATAIRRRHGRAPALLGYCMGGTMALVFAAQRPALATHLILLATPVDFDHLGLLTLWARHEGLDVDDLIETYGIVPPAVLQPAFTLLRPQVLTRKWVTLLQLAGEPDKLQAYLPMFRWATDNVALPGAALRTWVRDYFRKNGLVRRTLLADGRPVDLARLAQPVLNIVALEDHIVAPASPRALGALLDSTADYRLREYPCGHVDLSVSPAMGATIYDDALDWLDAQNAAPARAPKPGRRPKGRAS
jgi:polyhydroxyalkanoate synthase subunit PhaC